MVSGSHPSTQQIDEINRLIALTERVKKRKDAYRAANMHIDAERSHLVTASWQETEGEPLDIRRAKLFKKIMEGISVVIRDGELIVGSQTKYIRGASPTVEWKADFALDFAARGKPAAAGMTAADITDAERESLLKDAHYWQGKSAVDGIHKMMNGVFGDYIDDLDKNRVCLAPIEKTQAGQVLGYETVINKGFNGIIAEARERVRQISAGDFLDLEALNKMHFLQAVIIACEGMINFARRYAELAKELAGKESNALRKKELEDIADICLWVPANPARSFHEAVQSLWFTHLGEVLEHNRSGEAAGRMDQYLYPLYKKDLDAGRLTRQEAAELLGSLWVKFAERESAVGGIWKSAAQSNASQLVTIGGVSSDGRDATNELTYLLLEVARQLRTIQPPLYLRCHVGTPAELWMKAAEVLRDRGDGVPTFINDRAVILNFTSLGLPLPAVRDFAVAGCVHPRMNYNAVGSVGDVTLCTLKILELALNNGVDPRTGKQLGPTTGDPRNFTSFNQLYDAYKQQFSFFTELFGRYMRMYSQVRNLYYSLPYLSALLGDCVEKGLDATRGGVRYPQTLAPFQDRGGVQNVADSLSAIKKLVFEEKKLTIDRLLQALKADFEGDGNKDIQRMLLAAPKYGNDDDYADDVFNDLSLWQQYRLSEEITNMGYKSRVIRGGAAYHIHLGKLVGATPDGRRAGEPVADGTLSPMRGADVKGPMAVINSASKVNHTEVAISSLFNMKLNPSVMQSQEGRQKVINLIKTYFDRGGYLIQLNVQRTEQLCEAKKHPEQYRDHLVKVAGYSAYFVDLSPALQDDIIARTEHTL